MALLNKILIKENLEIKLKLKKIKNVTKLV